MTGNAHSFTSTSGPSVPVPVVPSAGAVSSIGFKWHNWVKAEFHERGTEFIL